MVDDKEDSSFRQAVLSALRVDERLSSQLVDVEVSGGRVVLSGTVQSYRGKLAAQDVAAAVVGQDSIENRIEVSAPGSPEDGDIADEVRTLLAREDRLVQHGIVVAVRTGKVFLSGSVADEQLRVLAEDVALRVPGAREVTNQLVVEPASSAESAVVASELEHELSTDPELAGCRLQVATSGDVAVLAGTAGSRLQVERAVALLRRSWVGELRVRVTVPD